MTQLNALPPSKIYRGTIDEVFSHRDEIPSGATVELKANETDGLSGYGSAGCAHESEAPTSSLYP